MDVGDDQLSTLLQNSRKVVNPVYGQLVIGPPGSGKTTYCQKITQFYREKLKRNVAVVNLDPANENMEYDAAINIMDLITVESVMAEHHLGPNGALIYCMDYLQENFSWLFSKLKASTCNYFIFDCPGQVELYTHHRAITKIFGQLEKIGYHLCTVHLIESHYISEPTKYISTLLLSLMTMLHMPFPHVNVLSKADLLKQFESKLLFSVDYYTDVLDLNFLLDVLNETPGTKKHVKLNKAIVSMIEDYSLVSFQLLDIDNIQSLIRLKNAIDKANGWVYGQSEEMTVQTLLECAVGGESETKRMGMDVDPYV